MRIDSSMSTNDALFITALPNLVAISIFNTLFVIDGGYTIQKIYKSYIKANQILRKELAMGILLYKYYCFCNAIYYYSYSIEALANKNNIPFKVVLKFNDYVKIQPGTTIFQIVILIIDLFIFFLCGNNDYSTSEVLIMVTCTNLILFEPAVSLTTLIQIGDDMSNIKNIA